MAKNIKQDVKIDEDSLIDMVILYFEEAHGQATDRSNVSFGIDENQQIYVKLKNLQSLKSFEDEKDPFEGRI
jgi:hypothetical protein